MRCASIRTQLSAAAVCSIAALACTLTQSMSAPAASQAPAATALPSLVAPIIAASATTAATQAPQVTATPSATSTPQPSPTASGPLKGTVTQRSNCRYGPGAYYLYKIGLVQGAPIDVLGRTIDGGWALVQYTGTTNRCWINSKLIQASGDIMSLPDMYKDSSSLPLATNFGPVSITSASGSAVVEVEWVPIALPEAYLLGENEALYVVEVWTCLNGSPAFYTVGTNESSATFEVDNSCGVVSHANIVAQNKLGVSGITPIPIP